MRALISLSIAPGTRFGAYEILSPLGAGGMGEVYRARDTKLNRDVAIKVLPETVAADRDRLARFEREAQVLAALNHPYIAHIHGFEDSTGTPALVMELVEGPTLADRIAKGPIPIDEAIAMARQIAEALEAAHEQGIIHRDLKPANIKVRRDGTVKVLDFGLAKAVEATAGLSPSVAELPTITTPAMTQVGVILGTAAYMSPEQARGKVVDKRADIWAFGVVLYEMLTSRRAFEGDETSVTLALVMTTEPKWELLPGNTPAGLRRLLTRCLRKDPRSRMRDIGEARLQLEELAAESGAHATPPRASPKAGVSLPFAVAVAAMAAIVASIVVWSLKSAAPSSAALLARMTVSLPEGAQLEDLQFPAVALSPDGKQLVYAAVKTGIRQLYIRSLDNLEVKGIAGTEDATIPFFSPDGQWIGFFAGGKLKKVSINGSAAQTLWNTPLGAGGSWGPDNTIYFSPSSVSSLWKIPASGGKAEPLTTLDRSKGETSHRWPQVLPGGRAVLFTVWTGPGYDEKYVAVQSLENGERHVLWNGADTGRYVGSGHLAYTRADALMAVPLDLAHLKVTSNAPVILDEAVWTGAQGAHFAVSDTGVLAYVQGEPKRYDRQLVWVDRSGRVEPLPTPPRPYMSPQLSPDGGRVAVEIWEGTIGIWIYDFARGTLTKLTSAGSSQQPTWTPDGSRIVYRATRSGSRNLFWLTADGSHEEERLSTSGNMQTPASLSPDGKWLAYHEISSNSGRALWVMQPAGDRSPQPFLKTASNVNGPRFSPDGRWLAYVSDESGRAQICIRPFPGPGGTLQVSTLGGTEPLWSRDGRELFYLNGDKLMAVDVTRTPSLTVGSPRLLFSGRFETSVINGTSYDVSPDGRRFLRVLPPETAQDAKQIQVVINWNEELKRRVRAR